MFDLFKRCSASAALKDNSHQTNTSTQDSPLPRSILHRSRGKENETLEKFTGLVSLINTDDEVSLHEKVHKRVHWHDAVEEITLPTHETPMELKYVQLKEANDDTGHCVRQHRPDVVRSQAGASVKEQSKARCRGTARRTIESQILVDTTNTYKHRADRRQRCPRIRRFQEVVSYASR